MKPLQCSDASIDSCVVQSSSEKMLTAAVRSNADTHRQMVNRRASNLEASIKSLPLEFWEPSLRWGRSVGARGVETTGRSQPQSSESTEQSSQGISETEAVAAELAWVCARSSAWMLRLLAWVLEGLLTLGLGVSITLLPAPEILFHPLGCLAQPWCECLCLLLLHLLLPSSTDALGRLALFWGQAGVGEQIWRKRKWGNWEEWRKKRLC